MWTSIRMQQNIYHWWYQWESVIMNFYTRIKVARQNDTNCSRIRRHHKGESTQLHRLTLMNGSCAQLVTSSPAWELWVTRSNNSSVYTSPSPYTLVARPKQPIPAAIRWVYHHMDLLFRGHLPCMLHLFAGKIIRKDTFWTPRIIYTVFMYNIHSVHNI